MAISEVEDVGGVVHLLGSAPIYARRHRHGAGYPMHSHSFVEVVVVASGSALHESALGSEPVREGDVLILQPGVAHGYSSCRNLVVFNCGLSTSLLHTSLSWMASDTAAACALFKNASLPYGSQIYRGRLLREQLASRLGRMIALEDLCGDSSEPRAEFLATLILFLDDLVRTATDNEGTLSKAITHPAVVEGISLMEACLDDPWTLTALAGRLHMTPSHTVRLFKSQTGLPPLAYLAKRRAEAAARLLISTDYTVSRIGREVGWHEANYFTRRFRTHFGLPPTAYRERFRLGKEPERD